MRNRFPRAARLPRAANTPRFPKLPPLRYGIFTPEGRLIRVCEVADPRNRICSTFNELRYLATDGIAGPLTDESEVANG